MAELTDLTCIGALNVDYIATQKMFEGDRERERIFVQVFGRNSERVKTEAQVDQALGLVDLHRLHTSLGGSAYNTAKTVASFG